MRKVTLKELARWIEGHVRGNADLEITNALPLSDADEHSITLVDNVRNFERLDRSPAPAAIVPADFSVTSEKTLICVDMPHQAFEKLVKKLRPHYETSQTGIHSRACVHASALIGEESEIQAGAVIGENVTIGKRCHIHSGVVIEADCRLGDDCVLFPNVTLYSQTILEDRVVVHSGAVLGAYGFGYRQTHGKHERTAQLGWVHLGNDVEIGAATTIDRGTYGSTRIGEGTKIDNQVQIGHNCQIGKHNLICALVGIAGSCSTGNYVVIAGQVGMKDHTHIGDRVQIGAQSGVMDDIPSDEIWTGSPAIPHKQAMVNYASIGRLYDMRRQLRELQREVETLQQTIDKSACQAIETPAQQSKRHAA